MRSSRRRDAAGFTLIELLVVVLIIAVMIGVAGVNLMRGPEDEARDESERLAMVLRAARDEAILEGRVYTLATDAGGYRFLRLEKDGRLKPLADDLLRPHDLPAGVAIEALNIDGATGTARDGLVFLPSGELPAFRLVLSGGKARYSVVGEADGTIRTQVGT